MERRDAIRNVLASAVGSIGAMWLPPALRDKVVEDGVDKLTPEELNTAMSALSRRVASLEARVEALETLGTAKIKKMMNGMSWFPSSSSTGFP